MSYTTGHVSYKFEESIAPDLNRYSSPKIIFPFPARELLPSIAAVIDEKSDLDIELELFDKNGSIGNVAFGNFKNPAKARDSNIDGVTLECDIILSTIELTAAKFKLTWVGAVKLYSLDIAIASQPYQKGRKFDLGEVSDTIQLPIKPISQFRVAHGTEFAGEICSATSVSCVLRYLDREVEPLELANFIYDPYFKRYGLWWRAILGLAQHGVMATLHYFRSWQEVYNQLAKGYPVIACIAYDIGELHNSPISSTMGHVVTIAGIGKKEIFCADSAALDEKIKIYDIKEFEKAWFDNGGGVGYLINKK